MKNKNLIQSKSDIVISLSKGAIGAIPIAGAALGEIFSIAIPNQRLDRVADFVSKLEERINDTEQNALKNNKYFIDLLEDAILQASKSLSEERNKYIASFIAKNRNISDKDHSIKKKLLRILEELTDEDVEILKSLNDSRYQRTAQKYMTQRQSIGVVQSFSKEENYIYEMSIASWDAHMNSLEKSGLVRAERTIPATSEQNTRMDHIDDETGLPKVSGYQINDLGKLLLQSIDEQSS